MGLRLTRERPKITVTVLEETILKYHRISFGVCFQLRLTVQSFGMHHHSLS